MSEQLEPGSYGIYVSDVGAGAATPDAFTVTGPGGDPVATYEPTTSEDISLPQGSFSVLAEFEAQESGTYQVAAQPADGVIGQFVVARHADARRSPTGRGGGSASPAVGCSSSSGSCCSRSASPSGAAPGKPWRPPMPRAVWTPYAQTGGYPGYQQPYAQQPFTQQPYAQQPYAAPTPQQQAPQPQAGPPAGWYPDPGRAGGQRYWDGTRWTDHTA